MDTAADFNTLTASWSGVRYLRSGPVAFVFIRPEGYTNELIERIGRITLSSFYPEQYSNALQFCGSRSGRDTDKARETVLVPIELEKVVVTSAQARLTIVDRKLFKTSMQEADFIDKSVLTEWYGGSHSILHDMYIVEIDKVVRMRCIILTMGKSCPHGSQHGQR